MKKRIISWLLVLCMTLTLIPAGAVRTLAENAALPGDADGSGIVDLLDVNMLERYLAGDSAAVKAIHEKNADVNADGTLSGEDVRLLREYLVGNVTLTDHICTLSFDTDGAEEIPPIQTGIGYLYRGEIPTPSKDGFLFSHWVNPDGTPFYQAEERIAGDMTLKAVYTPAELQQELNLSSFSLQNQPADVSFRLAGSFASAQQVRENLALLPKDGSDPVDFTVSESGAGQYTVSAPGGFRPGASYALTLGDGLTFADKDAMYRTVYFMIRKEESDHLKFDPDMIFIRDTEEMRYTLQGREQPADVLQADLLSSDTSESAITGSFPMSGGGLAVGDVVCIYEKEDPRNRDYTQKDYEDDALAYVRITSVSGNIYGFESLNEEDADQVLAMPDTVLFQVDTLPAGPGTVRKSDYDANARLQLGQTGAPEFSIYDILVFYTGSFREAIDPANRAQAEQNVVYGQITAVDGDTVSYQLITRQEIDDFTGMFVTQQVDGDKILQEIDQEKILYNVQRQAEASGFAQQAAQSMVEAAWETEDFRRKLRDNGLTEQEIQELQQNPVDLAAGGGTGTGSRRTVFVVEGVTAIPTFIKGKRFENGIGLQLDVTLTLSIDTRISPTQTSSLKIELTAGFEEELSFSFDVNVDDKWEVYGIIPVLEDLDVTASVDIQNYTSVSVCAKFYTVGQENAGKWQALSGANSGPLSTPRVKTAIRRINLLQPKLAKMKARGEDIQGILDQINGYKEMIPKVVVDGVEYSFDQLEEALGGEDVSASFEEVFSAKTEAENKVGMEQLMDRYQEMLNQECDWVLICDQLIFSREFHIKVVAIRLDINFVIRGNVNIAIGADLEYQVGKRYSFWLHLMEGTSGSAEMDLIDERFGFQFYVMGTLGLRVGIKAEIALGIISTRIASVGVNVEFGPYLRLWGYFVYIYEKLRPANTSQWSENTEMLGALYVEFGLYVAVHFKAQVFNNLFKYEPTLYDQEFPLLTAGVKQNVYDFALHPQSDDRLYIEDADSSSINGISMPLPDCYRNMKTIDLCSGEKKQVVYPADRFLVSFTDSRFTMDENGDIRVNVPQGTRYLQCDMRIVWKCDKVAFSKYDTDITVPVIWTNLTEVERQEKFTAAVAVGCPETGYRTVWSGRYGRLDSLDLPSRETILELINYSSFHTEQGNLRYASVEGYQGETTGLHISGDQTFYFEAVPRTYTLSVEGVQERDGTTGTRTFTAPYGGSFQLKSLEHTGTENPEAGVYTAYDGLRDGKGQKTEQTLTVDLQFLEAYGTAPVFTAAYRDEALTASYEFIGIGGAAPVTVKFQKGTVPQWEGLEDYVGQRGGFIRSISPAPAASETSLTYTVLCEKAASDTSYALSFETNGGAPMETKQLQASACIIPASPVYPGHDFAGWYLDSGLTEPFAANMPMPAKDMTLYAAWELSTYAVSFERGLETAAGECAPIAVVYSEPYGALPVLTDETMRFLGWFAEDGTEIKADTPFLQTSDQVLTGRWEKKLTPDPAWIVIPPVEEQTYTYSGESHALRVNAAQGHEDILTGLVVEYLWEPAGADGSYTTEPPVNGGTYTVKLTRPGDDNYIAMAERVQTGAIHIGPACMLKEMNRFNGEWRWWVKRPRLEVQGNSIQVFRPEDVAVDPTGMGKETYTIWVTVGSEPMRLLETVEADSEGNYTFTNLDTNQTIYTIQYDIGASLCYEAIRSGGVTHSYELHPVSYSGRTQAAGAEKLGTARPSAECTLLSLNGYTRNSGNTVQLASHEGVKMLVTGENIVLNRGRTFAVKLEIPETVSLWGVLASVEYDRQLLHLMSCKPGEIFGENQFTMQKDMDAVPYKFLASRSTIDAAPAAGTFVILHFRVLADAENKDTSISIHTLQAVGEAAEADLSTGSPLTVAVDSKAPRVKGIQNGGVYTGPVTVQVEEPHLDKVQVNGEEISLDGDSFVLQPQDGLQTVVLTDLAGNTLTLMVTVRASEKTEPTQPPAEETVPPANPTSPSEPAAPTEPAPENTAPTGDDSCLHLIAAMLIISGIGAAAVAVLVLKKRRTLR